MLWLRLWEKFTGSSFCDVTTKDPANQDLRKEVLLLNPVIAKKALGYRFVSHQRVAAERPASQPSWILVRFIQSQSVLVWVTGPQRLMDSVKLVQTFCDSSQAA